MGGISSRIDSAQSSGGKGSAPTQANVQSSFAQQPSIQTHWGQPQPLDGVQNGYFAQPPQTPQPMGKGGVQSNSATSGQPRIGQQNQYSNTVGQWDNTQQQPQSHFGGGKGKG